MLKASFTHPASALGALALGALLALPACSPEEAVAVAVDDARAAAIATEITDDGEDGHTDVPDYGDPGEVTGHVDDLGLNLDVFEYVTVPYPDGTTEEKVMVGGDVLLSPEEFAALTAPGVDRELATRQYRTYNLVSPRTIRIIGYTGGGGYGLQSRTRTALQWAVNNYNALNLDIRFSLSFSSSTNADMVVYRNPNNGNAGGSAGFPSGGRPNKWVQIWRGLDNYNTNTQEHVVTHEIGHSVGLRHTDYFSRQSCGQNSNEGAGSNGAVHIPGTPTGYDGNSLMRACFGNEDGEFGYYDRVALQYLY